MTYGHDGKRHNKRELIASPTSLAWSERRRPPGDRLLPGPRYLRLPRAARRLRQGDGHDGGQAGQDGDGSSKTVALASGSRVPALPAATVVLGPAPTSSLPTGHARLGSARPHPDLPSAAPLERCAEPLGVDLDAILEPPVHVEPYVRVDGIRVWILRQFDRYLRPETYGRVRGGDIAPDAHGHQRPAPLTDAAGHCSFYGATKLEGLLSVLIPSLPVLLDTE
jgi:hypothetical protein